MSKHPFNRDALGRLKYWIIEREKARAWRERGAAGTKDPIIQKFRFCNVRRNDDRVTRWVHEHWLHPYTGHPNLWFAMVVARLVNWPDTLADIQKSVFNGSGRVRWLPDVFVAAMHYRKACERKVFSGAYIVSTNGNKMDKAEYLAQRVLNPLWAERIYIAEHIKADTLASFHARLTRFDGLGSFMAAQVVADIKYDALGPLAAASDWHTWAAPGPGSLRGMIRLLGGDCHPDETGRAISDRVWLAHFETLWPLAQPWLEGGITGQDLQNCLCEWDKYERVRLNQGRPRSLYAPHG